MDFTRNQECAKWFLHPPKRDDKCAQLARGTFIINNFFKNLHMCNPNQRRPGVELHISSKSLGMYKKFTCEGIKIVCTWAQSDFENMKKIHFKPEKAISGLL